MDSYNTELTYFYTNNYLNYIVERFNYENFSYFNETNDYKFIAPILYTNNKVESGTLSYLPLPFISHSATAKQAKNELKNFFEKIYKLASKRIAFRQDPSVVYSNQIIKSMLQEGFVPNIFYTSIVDLCNDENILWHNTRKSFKSLINGLKNNSEYKLIIVDSVTNIEGINDWINMYINLVKRGGGNPTKDKFKNIETSVKENFAYLYLLYNNSQELISGVHITFNNSFAYYSASGTNINYENSDYFSHYLLWNAMLDLKLKGFKKLEIGPIFYDNVKNFYQHSLKELSISDFKIGMGGELVPFTIWEKLF